MTSGLEGLVPFALFWLVAILTPGPNTLLFTWIALSSPRHVTLAAIAGILSCGVLWAFGGLFGLVWVTRSFPGLFKAVEIAGGIYIGWRGAVLASRLFRRKKTGDPVPSAAPGGILPAAAWRMGFLTNLSNPKSLVFVASLFATTSVAQGPIWLGLTGVAIMLSMSAAYYAGLFFLFSMPGAAAVYRKCQTYLETGAGFIFLGFAADLLVRGLT